MNTELGPFALLGALATVAVILWAIAVAGFSLRRRRPYSALFALAVGVVCIRSWWGVAPFARKWSGWKDEDGDGMLDGFANGNYDAFSMYGGHTGALVLGVSLICFIALSIVWRRVKTRNVDSFHLKSSLRAASVHPYSFRLAPQIPSANLKLRSVPLVHSLALNLASLYRRPPEGSDKAMTTKKTHDERIAVGI